MTCRMLKIAYGAAASAYDTEADDVSDGSDSEDDTDIDELGHTRCALDNQQMWTAAVLDVACDRSQSEKLIDEAAEAIGMVILAHVRLVWERCRRAWRRPVDGDGGYAYLHKLGHQSLSDLFCSVSSLHATESREEVGTQITKTLTSLSLKQASSRIGTSVLLSIAADVPLQDTPLCIHLPMFECAAWAGLLAAPSDKFTDLPTLLGSATPPLSASKHHRPHSRPQLLAPPAQTASPACVIEEEGELDDLRPKLDSSVEQTVALCAEYCQRLQHSVYERTLGSPLQVPDTIRHVLPCLVSCWPAIRRYCSVFVKA
jgi:hypothetical protein